MNIYATKGSQTKFIINGIKMAKLIILLFWAKIITLSIITFNFVLIFVKRVTYLKISPIRLYFAKKPKFNFGRQRQTYNNNLNFK